MARIRTIKPEFWSSEQVVECSTTARLLFVGLWNFCDDGGVHQYSIKRIKMQIFPGDDMSDELITGLVEELLTVGLLRAYTAENKRYLLVTGWHHQKIDKPTLRFPQPSEGTEFDDHSTSASRGVDDRSPPEGNGMEWKGCNTPYSPPKGTGRGGKKFTKPTAEQVQAYCTQRDNGITGEEFIAHYETVGWVVGKNRSPMKDWKAAVVTWEQRRKKPPAESRVATAADLEGFDLITGAMR